MLLAEGVHLPQDGVGEEQELTVEFFLLVFDVLLELPDHDARCFICTPGPQDLQHSPAVTQDLERTEEKKQKLYCFSLNFNLN